MGGDWSFSLQGSGTVAISGPEGTTKVHASDIAGVRSVDRAGEVLLAFVDGNGEELLVTGNADLFDPLSVADFLQEVAGVRGLGKKNDASNS